MFTTIMSATLVVVVIIAIVLTNRMVRWSRQANYLGRMLQGVRPHVEGFEYKKEERFPRYLERSHKGLTGGFDWIHAEPEHGSHLWGIVWIRISGKFIHTGLRRDGWWEYPMILAGDNRLDYYCQEVRRNITILAAEKGYLLENDDFQEIYTPLLKELDDIRRQIIGG